MILVSRRSLTAHPAPDAAGAYPRRRQPRSLLRRWRSPGADLMGRRETRDNARSHVLAGVRLARGIGPGRAPTLGCAGHWRKRLYSRLGSTEVVVYRDSLARFEAHSPRLAGVQVEYESLAKVAVEYDSLCAVAEAGEYECLTGTGVAVDYECPAASDAECAVGVKSLRQARLPTAKTSNAPFPRANATPSAGWCISPRSSAVFMLSATILSISTGDPILDLYVTICPPHISGYVMTVITASHNGDVMSVTPPGETTPDTPRAPSRRKSASAGPASIRASPARSRPAPQWAVRYSVSPRQREQSFKTPYDLLAAALALQPARLRAIVAR